VNATIWLKEPIPRRRNPLVVVGAKSVDHGNENLFIYEDRTGKTVLIPLDNIKFAEIEK
jgi:hypothetical protein